MKKSKKKIKERIFVVVSKEQQVKAFEYIESVLADLSKKIDNTRK